MFRGLIITFNFVKYIYIYENNSLMSDFEELYLFPN